MITRRTIFSIRTAGLFILGILLQTTVDAQSIERGTFSSGVGSSSGESGRIHGTVSQSVAGRSDGYEENSAYSRFGIWHTPRVPSARVLVSLPEREAYVGSTLTIPIQLDSVAGYISGARRDFTARIQYNASLLDPLSPGFSCLRIGDTCFLDVTGTAIILPGIIATLDFRAMLGNSTTTDLKILSFSWVTVGEEVITTTRRDGLFTLLGVCVEGDSVRLIHSSAFGARVSVAPNPVRTTATISFASVEAGETTIELIDARGGRVAEIVRLDAAADRLYDFTADLRGIASGSYMLLCKTPSQRIVETLFIIE